MVRFYYSISKDEWIKGWELYYKQFKQKWMLIRAAIFLVPLVLFIEQVIKDPAYGVGWVCIVICIACIVSMLLSKKVEKKNYLTALDGLKDDSYVLTINGTELTLETVLPESDREFLDTDEQGEVIEMAPIPPSVYDLTDKSFKCIETADIIGVFSEALGCVIPKSQLSNEDLTSLKFALKDALAERYIEN